MQAITVLTNQYSLKNNQSKSDRANMKAVNNKMVFICLVLAFSLSITPALVKAQIGNTQPPSSGSGVGSGNGPFTDPNGPNPTPTDPGGPTDPPPDVVPIDGGVTILLAIGLVHGFQISRKRKIQLKPQVAK
jgi:hypothetical protein